MRLFVLLLCLVISPITGYAQDSVPEVREVPEEIEALYVRYRLPLGTSVFLEGERLQAFNFEEYMQLLQMDSDLKTLSEKTTILQEKTTILSGIIEDYKEALQHSKEAREISEEEAERLDELFQSTLANKTKQLKRSRRRAKIGWGIAGASTVGLASMLVALLLGG